MQQFEFGSRWFENVFFVGVGFSGWWFENAFCVDARFSRWWDFTLCVSIGLIFPVGGLKMHFASALDFPDGGFLCMTTYFWGAPTKNIFIMYKKNPTPTRRYASISISLFRRDEILFLLADCFDHFVGPHDPFTIRLCES